MRNLEPEQFWLGVRAVVLGPTVTVPAWRWSGDMWQSTSCRGMEASSPTGRTSSCDQETCGRVHHAEGWRHRVRLEERHPVIRRHVAEYIMQRDGGIESDWKNV